MTRGIDDFEHRWNLAIAAGLVGSRHANRKQLLHSTSEASPKAAAMIELGFPGDFWLPLRAAKCWRADEYPARRSVDSVRTWMCLMDELLNPRPDPRDIFVMVDRNSGLRVIHQANLEIVRKQAPDVWMELGGTTIDDFKLSNLQNYALQALSDLDATSFDTRCTIGEIAKTISTSQSEVSLKRPISFLVKLGLLQSTPGPSGGVWLSTTGIRRIKPKRKK